MPPTKIQRTFNLSSPAELPSTKNSENDHSASRNDHEAEDDVTTIPRCRKKNTFDPAQLCTRVSVCAAKTSAHTNSNKNRQKRPKRKRNEVRK